jgi:hypothetical protein
MILDLFALGVSVCCTLLFCVLRSIASQLAEELSLQRSDQTRPGETDWDYFERRSGHRFHLEGSTPTRSFCARCGTSLSFWQTRFAELARSTCPGPYREPLWLRLLRWLKARMG